MGKKISIVLERRGTHDKVFKFYCFSATNRKKKFFCTGLITYTTFNYRKMALSLSPPLNKVILLLGFKYVTSIFRKKTH